MLRQDAVDVQERCCGCSGRMLWMLRQDAVDVQERCCGCSGKALWMFREGSKRPAVPVTRPRRDATPRVGDHGGVVAVKSVKCDIRECYNIGNEQNRDILPNVYCISKGVVFLTLEKSLNGRIVWLLVGA